MWPFRKPVPPAPPPASTGDNRVWNEDWKVGDIAECIVDGVDRQWNAAVHPWERPAFGQRLTVCGFSEGLGRDTRVRHYFLKFSEWPAGMSTTAFRKVRPVASEKSEIVERILNATPGKDRVLEDT